MDVWRFFEMLSDFNRFPTLFSIARTQVLLPGDKGYPVQRVADPEIAKRVLARETRTMGKEPEWMRNARVKAERRMGKSPKNG